MYTYASATYDAMKSIDLSDWKGGSNGIPLYVTIALGKMCEHILNQKVNYIHEAPTRFMSKQSRALIKLD